MVGGFSVTNQRMFLIGRSLKVQSYYIYKVVISVCPIITREPLNGFASNFDWGTLETHGNVLSLFLGF